MCSGEKRLANYIPSDVETIQVDVLKYSSCDNKVAASANIISSFELGNTGSSEMSGSLDNIDSGCYRVEVDLTRIDNVENYIRQKTDEPLLMFQGFADVEIAGDGTSSLARIVLQSKAPDMTIPNLPRPSQPAFIVAISQQGGVLKKGDDALLNVDVINPNDPQSNAFDTPFSNTKIHIHVEHFGEFNEENEKPTITFEQAARGPDFDAWTPTASTAHTEDYYTKVVHNYPDLPGDVDASNDVSVGVKVSAVNSRRTSSHQVSFQPYACRAFTAGTNEKPVDPVDYELYCNEQSNHDEWLLGRKEKFTVTIAPVGDLDLQLVILSRLQCVSDDAYLGTGSSTAGFGCIKAIQSRIAGGELYPDDGSLFNGEVLKCKIHRMVQALYRDDPSVNFPRSVLENGKSSFEMFFRAPIATRSRFVAFKLKPSEGSTCQYATATISNVAWTRDRVYTAHDVNENAKIVSSGGFESNIYPSANFQDCATGNNGAYCTTLSTSDNELLAMKSQTFDSTLSDSTSVYRMAKDLPSVVFAGGFVYFRVTVDVNPLDNWGEGAADMARSFCSFDVESEIAFEQNANDNDDFSIDADSEMIFSGVTSQNLNFQAVGSSHICGDNAEDMEKLIKGIQHDSCPVIKNIVWGSTSGFASECDDGTSTGQDITMCIYRSKTQNLGDDEQVATWDIEHYQPDVRLYKALSGVPAIELTAQSTRRVIVKDSAGSAVYEDSSESVESCPTLFNVETNNGGSTSGDIHPARITNDDEVTTISNFDGVYGPFGRGGGWLKYLEFETAAQVKLSFTYWAGGSWDAEHPYMYVSNTENWFQLDGNEDKIAHPSSTDCPTGWEKDQYPHGTTHDATFCKKVVEFVVTPTKGLLDQDLYGFELYLGSSLDENSDNEAFYITDIHLEGLETGYNYRIEKAWEYTFRYNYDCSQKSNERIFFHVTNPLRAVGVIPGGSEYESDSVVCSERVMGLDGITDGFDQPTYDGQYVEPQFDFEQNMCAGIKSSNSVGENWCGDINPGKRRGILQAQKAPGCQQSPYGCAANNQVPFDIKVEDGRLTVSMDADEFVGKSIKVTSNPTGIIPKRTKFIASDFAPKLNDVGSTWTSTLKSKVSQIMSSANMKKNLVPGVTAADLIACCDLNPDEAAEVTKFMGEVVTNEKNAFYTVSLIQQSNEQEQAQQQQQNQATGTTSTSTTTTSTESSSGSLLIVVAVPAILVLVAVIALVVVTTRSKATADRVVDMRQRTTRQASWQKGGAVDMDF
jgi:hypothetical protein